MVIATTGEMFREFERRYGDKVPEVRGDFTPYWEDGAASSARETALARSRRRTAGPGRDPLDDAPAGGVSRRARSTRRGETCSCTTSTPGERIAASASRTIRSRRANGRSSRRSPWTPTRSPGRWSTRRLPSVARRPRRLAAIDVLQHGVVAADRPGPAAGRAGRGRRRRHHGRRQAGRVAAAAPRANWPCWPRTCRRWAPSVSCSAAGDGKPSGSAKAEGATLDNGRLRLTVDTTSGAIASLRVAGRDESWSTAHAGLGLNEYVYVPSRNAKDAVRVQAVAIRVEDAGPLVATLVVEGDAPGCRKLDAAASRRRWSRSRGHRKRARQEGRPRQGGGPFGLRLQRARGNDADRDALGGRSARGRPVARLVQELPVGGPLGRRVERGVGGDLGDGRRAA